MTNLTKALLQEKAKGGLGADPLVGDQVNQRPIHYAIAFKNESVFEAHLDHLIEKEAAQTHASPLIVQDALRKINCNSIPHTLASFCVVKQSWRCLSKLLEKKGLAQLEVKLTL